MVVVGVDEIGGSLRLDIMSLLFESPSRPRLREFLSRKNENDIPSFVTKRHSLRERALPGSPPHIDPQRLISPRTYRVERLVAKGFDHPEQFCLGLFARHFCDKTNDSWHWPLPLKSFFHVLELAAIPGFPQFTKLGSHAFRMTVNQSVVQAQSKGGPALECQRNAAARRIDRQEPVDCLE